MKRYYFRSGTPMGFHHFLQFLCFGNVLSVISELLVLSEHASYTSWPTAFLLFLIGGFPSLAACLFLIGTCCRKVLKRYAFVAVHVWFYGVLAVESLFFLVNLFVGEMIFETSIATLLAAVVWCIPVTIYYHKRKPLFYPELIPDSVYPKSMQTDSASKDPGDMSDIERFNSYYPPEKTDASKSALDSETQPEENNISAAPIDTSTPEEYTYQPRRSRRSKSKKASKTKRFIFQIMLVLFLVLYELIFIGIALITKLNPYVLIGIYAICCACGIKYHRMMKMSAFERPLIYNKDMFCAAFNLVNIFGYLPIIACFFIDWKIALIGLPVGLFGSAFLTGLIHYIVEIPLCAMHRALDTYAEKHFGG